MSVATVAGTELQQALRCYADADAALLRALGGAVAERSYVLESLSARSIDELALAPSQVSVLVDVASAISTQALQNVVRGWPAPRASSHHLCWRHVWRVSARHLVRLGAMTVEELDPVVHRTEIELLGPRDREAWSLEEAARSVHGLQVGTEQHRRAMRRPLSDPANFNRLLPELAPEALYLLRSYEAQLDATLVQRCALHASTRRDWKSLSAWAELLRVVRPTALDPLRLDFARALPHQPLGDDGLRLALVLTSDWPA